MAAPPKPAEFFDFLEAFDGGVNQTRSPLKLDKSILSHGINTTVRGDFVTHRPPYKRRLVGYADEATQAMVEGGLFQGACFYQPDNGTPSLMCAISGNLFQFSISGDTITCTRVNGAVTQSASADQHWLFQAEMWIIWDDGINNPVFWSTTDPSTPRVSNYGTSVPTPISFHNTADFSIPAISATVVVTVDNTTNLAVQDVVALKNRGRFTVLVISGLNVTLLNNTAAPTGSLIAATVTDNFSGTHYGSGTELPPGRMGAYVQGRVWLCLPDARQFVAGDAVGGSSGTQALNYRDAVLNITENTYLSGGGTFIIPTGFITAMVDMSQLDASLGQGPLQVCTPTRVYSVNSPTDRTTWQDLTNPILAVSLISNGAKGQNSTVIANGDLMFRSIDGIRSLIMARQDFNLWGRTPISFEVDDVLRLDDPGLLRFGSAVVFDNRMLMTTHPVIHAQGVYWKGLIPLNFDPVSSLRGKLPSVYDAGVWTGINVLQVVLGQFNDVERAFSFVLNTRAGSTRIELWELAADDVDSYGHATPDNRYDNDGTTDYRIQWAFRSSSLRFGQNDPSTRKLMHLANGEIEVDDLAGLVDFNAGYYPDQYPCRVPWFTWQECQTIGDNGGKPGFRPRMGLGEPDSHPCDPDNNRPLRNCYTAQFDITITGHCVFKGARIKGVQEPQPEFAPPNCQCVSAEESGILLGNPEEGWAFGVPGQIVFGHR